MKRIGLLIILFLFLAISACQSSGSNATPAVGIPTPSVGKAVLTGIIARKGPTENADIPYIDIRLYIGTLLKDVTGTATIASVSELESPQTRTDSSGRFIFTDLDPGEYILAVQVPPNELLKLNHPETGKDMLIQLKSNEVVDLGILYYEIMNFITPNPIFLTPTPIP